MLSNFKEINMQNDHREYTKTSKKPRKDYTREIRERKRLGELATDILTTSATLSIAIIIAGAL